MAAKAKEEFSVWAFVFMIDYIHMNPVRRGLVERTCDWKWSSAARFQGVGESPVALDKIPPDWAGDGGGQEP